MKYYASFSGGKDSTAMVLRLIEEKRPLDEVIFSDTGMEFSEIYDTIKKVKKIVEANNIKFKILKPEKSFEYYMFDVEIKKSKAGRTGQKGYGWPGVHSRWCTRFLKKNLIDPYVKSKSDGEETTMYVGLAFDEKERAKKKNNLGHSHPLIDWGMTEADCLTFCFERGIDFGGIYNQQKRASCWCCPFQSLRQLRNLYTKHKDLWVILEGWDERVAKEVGSYILFHGTRVKTLSERFRKEELAKKEQRTLNEFVIL